MIPGVVEKDRDISSETEAKTSLLKLQDQLIAIREEYKLPKKCE